MAKSKYTEIHSISVEGVLNTEDMTIEIEDIGVKDLSKVLAKLNGCNIKIRVTLSNELE